MSRIRRVLGLRSSGAAGPHVGRNPAEPLTEREDLEEQMRDIDDYAKDEDPPDDWPGLD